MMNPPIVNRITPAFPDITHHTAVGTPTITTKGAPWEGLETHGCGWWTDVEVASLRAALADCAARSREELAEMGVRGRNWMLADFTWRNCAVRVQKAICGIIGP